MDTIQPRSARRGWLSVVVGAVGAVAITAGIITTPMARAAAHNSPAAQHSSAPTAAPVANLPTLPGLPSIPIPQLPSGSAGIAPAPPQQSPAALAQQMQAAITAASPGTQVGIDVVDTTTGATVADLNTGQQFYTASVVKLLIALDALNSQGWQPDPATTAQLEQMLSASDDTIADTLWDADGGSAIVSRMAGLMGLPGTQPPDDPSQWGETLTTAQDVVTVYRYLTNTVPQAARDVVMAGLQGADRTAADGTYQYFGIPDGLTGADWAIKQGWMSLDDSTTLDTTGLVGTGAGQPLRYVVVVLSRQPAGISWTTGGNALTAGVRVLHGTV
ncbi:serine hydrolase [Nocardia macrotermitis]|uniref:Beta-lactamase n=1 Tax=Nocardia macrotermitis TaxID=2585198 RepID=A0A7K0CVN9_9NOCA|nr:serine hydrolase [Nocardia macrotermitis]MQY17508.1 putative lipoprotein LppW [Nocardia macrotermitis]